MTIDATSTITDLEATITAATPTVSAAEVSDGSTVLGRLRSAYEVYLRRWGASNSGSLAEVTPRRTRYERAFALADRHARYTLSLTTTAPAAIAFTFEEATHDALVARADSAAASAAPAAALAELAVYRAEFDAAWAAGVAPVVSEAADASAEGIALTAAIARAEEAIAFLAWAQANPT